MGGDTRGGKDRRQLICFFQQRERLRLLREATFGHDFHPEGRFIRFLEHHSNARDELHV